jgi:hypothetical protein
MADSTKDFLTRPLLHITIASDGFGNFRIMPPEQDRK